MWILALKLSKLTYPEAICAWPRQSRGPDVTTETATSENKTEQRRRPVAEYAPTTVAVIRDVWIALNHKSIGLVAAGVAFYALLAAFPAITAMIAVGGLVIDPALMAKEMTIVTGILPETAARILTDQAREVASAGASGLTIAATVGLLVALFSSTRGVANLIKGLNIAQDRVESRGIFRLTLTTWVLTGMVVLGSIAALSIAMVLPVALRVIDTTLAGGGGTGAMLAGILRWPLLVALLALGLSTIYRFGPAPPKGNGFDDRSRTGRHRVRRLFSPGALIAIALWLPGSVVFTIYVRTFGTYAETFGALGGVVILLMWFWLTAYVILLGAVIDRALSGKRSKKVVGDILQDA